MGLLFVTIIDFLTFTICIFVFLISKLLVLFVEILDFHHSFELISFFRSFLCLSLGESDRNEPKNEKESQPFLPRKGAKRGFEYSQWTIWTSANAYLWHPARITFRLERPLSPRLTNVRRGAGWMRSSPLLGVFGARSKLKT